MIALGYSAQATQWWFTQLDARWAYKKEEEENEKKYKM